MRKSTLSTYINMRFFLIQDDCYVITRVIRVTELLLYVLLIGERAIYRYRKYIDNTLVTIEPPLPKCDHSQKTAFYRLVFYTSGKLFEPVLLQKGTVISSRENVYSP
jgi:hypothetical protein